MILTTKIARTIVDLEDTEDIATQHMNQRKYEVAFEPTSPFPQVFLVLALSNGLDAVILDPNDSRLISCLKAAQVMLGHDEFCAEYLKSFREGRLSG